MPINALLRARALALALLAGLILAACTQSDGDDERAIAEQNRKWLELVARKDASAVARIYAEDGAMLPPNAPKAEGRAALEAAWAGLFQIPGMSLTFKTERLVLSGDRTMATDVGSYQLTTGEGEAASVDNGKYVVVWTKRDGNWLVLTDMFSSDAPPPQETAAPEPPADLAPASMRALVLNANDASLQWTPCPPLFPAGCEMAVLQGNPALPNADVFLRVPGKYEIPQHWHTSAERMVLVSGELSVMYQDQAPATLTVGTYAYGPAKLPHKATCISDDPCTLFIAFESPVDAEPFEGELE